MRCVVGGRCLLAIAAVSIGVFAGGGDAVATSRTVATAAPPSPGAWVGKLSKYHTSQLTFRVSANHEQIHRFHTTVVPIVCGGGLSGPVTEPVSLGVSAATIKNDGTFRGKLVLRSQGGKQESKTTVAGAFTSATIANGTVTYKAGGCNVEEDFTAHKS